MLTIGDLIAVISLCLTSFGLGYTIGANSNKTEKKITAPVCKLSGYF